MTFTKTLDCLMQGKEKMEGALFDRNGDIFLVAVDLALFLCSQQASAITGQSIAVDGDGSTAIGY